MCRRLVLSLMRDMKNFVSERHIVCVHLLARTLDTHTHTDEIGRRDTLHIDDRLHT